MGVIQVHKIPMSCADSLRPDFFVESGDPCVAYAATVSAKLLIPGLRSSKIENCNHPLLVAYQPRRGGRCFGSDGVVSRGGSLRSRV